MFLYVCVCVFLASFVSIISPDSLHHPLKVYTCVESCSTVYFTHTKLRGRPKAYGQPWKIYIYKSYLLWPCQKPSKPGVITNSRPCASVFVCVCVAAAVVRLYGSKLLKLMSRNKNTGNPNNHVPVGKERRARQHPYLECRSKSTDHIWCFRTWRLFLMWKTRRGCGGGDAIQILFPTPPLL